MWNCRTHSRIHLACPGSPRRWVRGLRWRNGGRSLAPSADLSRHNIRRPFGIGQERTGQGWERQSSREPRLFIKESTPPCDPLQAPRCCFLALPDLLWVNPVSAMSCLLGFGTVFGTVFRKYRGEGGNWLEKPNWERRSHREWLPSENAPLCSSLLRLDTKLRCKKACLRAATHRQACQSGAAIRPPDARSPTPDPGEPIFSR